MLSPKIKQPVSIDLDNKPNSNINQPTTKKKTTAKQIDLDFPHSVSIRLRSQP